MQVRTRPHRDRRRLAAPPGDPRKRRGSLDLPVRPPSGSRSDRLAPSPFPHRARSCRRARRRVVRRPALGAPAASAATTSAAAAPTAATTTVAGDGTVLAFGAAGFYGSTKNLRLSHPLVGSAPTPSGHGYWLVASDGGVFSFGDAAFHGSTGAIHLNRPIISMSSTATGHGYWLVASDGGVFSFGDAAFYGSTGAIRLNAPIIAMTPTPSGHGYWLLASRRWCVLVRRRRVLRFDRRHPSEPAGRRHGVDADRSRLLARRAGRWHLLLRRRALLRFHGRRSTSTHRSSA